MTNADGGCAKAPNLSAFGFNPRKRDQPLSAVLLGIPMSRATASPIFAYRCLDARSGSEPICGARVTRYPAHVGGSSTFPMDHRAIS